MFELGLLLLLVGACTACVAVVRSGLRKVRVQVSELRARGIDPEVAIFRDIAETQAAEQQSRSLLTRVQMKTMLWTWRLVR